MADRIYVIYAGKIVEEGRYDPVFYDAKRPYAQMLLRAVPSQLKKIDGLEAIPGVIPSLTDPLKGCRSRPRRPFATDKCRAEEPPMIEVGDGHGVACWLYAKA